MSLRKHLEIWSTILFHSEKNFGIMRKTIFLFFVNFQNEWKLKNKIIIRFMVEIGKLGIYEKYYPIILLR